MRKSRESLIFLTGFILQIIAGAFFFYFLVKVMALGINAALEILSKIG
jgi:hypothetical protein